MGYFFYCEAYENKLLMFTQYTLTNHIAYTLIIMLIFSTFQTCCCRQMIVSTPQVNLFDWVS